MFLADYIEDDNRDQSQQIGCKRQVVVRTELCLVRTELCLERQLCQRQRV